MLQTRMKPLILENGQAWHSPMRASAIYYSPPIAKISNYITTPFSLVCVAINNNCTVALNQFPMNNFTTWIYPGPRGGINTLTNTGHSNGITSPYLNETECQSISTQPGCHERSGTPSSKHPRVCIQGRSSCGCRFNVWFNMCWICIYYRYDRYDIIFFCFFLVVNCINSVHFGEVLFQKGALFRNSYGFRWNTHMCWICRYIFIIKYILFCKLHQTFNRRWGTIPEGSSRQG